MDRLAIIAFALLLSLCAQPESSVETERRSAAPQVEPEVAPCHLEDATARYEGRTPVLAPGALVVHTDDSTTLHRLDERGQSTTTVALPGPVRALADVEDGFVVLAVGAEPSVAQLDADGTELHRIPLGEAAVDGALAIDGDTAWIALRDEDHAIDVHRVDLLAHRTQDAVPIGEGRGRLLVSAWLVTWGAADAAIWSPAGPLEGPGAPHAVVGPTIVYRATDRTGLWVGDAPPVRVTTPGTRANLPIAAASRDGFLLAYRSGGELWIQASHPTRGPLGEPMLVAADATPTALTTRGARLWVAWERDDTIEVRGGYCTEPG